MRLLPTVRFFPVVLIAFISAGAFGQSLTVVNRTGHTLELIQAAPTGVDHWGDDLIPGRVLLDGESVVLNLSGPSPWAFRFLDSEGEVYVVYDVNFMLTGKLSVGPENLAKLTVFAGAKRNISLNNQTGAVITSLRISSVTDGAWGMDVLDGRYIRDGETRIVEMAATPGTLSFDIRFTLLSDNREIPYEKNQVILTDGASLIITAR